MVAPDTFFGVLFQQLLAQSPILLVHLAGLIAAIVLYRRAPGPALLCMAGCVLTLLAVLGLALFWSVFMQRQQAGDGGHEAMRSWTSLAPIASSIARAVSAGL